MLFYTFETFDTCSEHLCMEGVHWETSSEWVIYLEFRSPGLLKTFTFSILNVSPTSVFTKANLQAFRNQVIPSLFCQH